MKVITENQIIVDGKGRTDIDDYYNTNGEGKKKKGGILGKVKSFVDSGKAGAVFTALASPGSDSTYTGRGSMPPAPPPQTKKPMSTTVKVLIGIGAAALVGGILYMVLKKKKGK